MSFDEKVMGTILPPEKVKVAKTLLSPEEVNELMKDWFVRDGETFTKITETHRLGWEETITSDTYSDFILKGSDLSDKDTFDYILKKVYQLSRNMLVSMNPPCRVIIRLNRDKDESFTDGKVVFVSTKILDDKEIPLGEKIDVILGLTIHEGCHLLYTDFADYRKASNRIVSSIANVVEDERIEIQLGEEKPGLVRFLEKVKYHYFDAMFLDHYEELPEENLFERIFNIFLKLIRYPKYLAKEDVSFFADYLVRIKDVLTPYPETTKEVIECSELIFLIIKDFYKEMTEEDLMKKLESGEISLDDLESASGVSTDGESVSISDELAEKLMERESKETVKKLGEAIKKHSEDSSKMADPSSMIGKHDSAILEGRYEVSGKGHFSMKAESNEMRYKNDLSYVKKYVPAIRKVLKYNDKDYEIQHKGMRSGYLDTSKIVEARQGVPTVYERKGYVKSDKVAVCLLIDLSGSMSGSRIQAARRCAILLNEALKDNNSVELFIYGHTADVSETYKADIHVYKEPGYNPPYALGSVEAISQNRDGDAIRETALRVRKHTKRKCLLFVIADGQPAASGYGGQEGIRDTRNAVKKIEKQGFDTVQITISSGYDPGLMFDNYILLDDLATLPRDLNKFIKKQLLKKQKIPLT